MSNRKNGRPAAARYLFCGNPYAGKKDEAQKQYALAAGLDLSEADKAELARQSQSKI